MVSDDRFALAVATAIGLGVFLMLGVVWGFGWQAVVGALPPAGGLWLWLTRRSRGRRRLDRQRFPDAWREVLEREVSFYRRLPEAERERFEREVRYFLSEHHMSGPRGEPVDDEVRILVGASAAILAFGRPGYRWPRLRDIVVHGGAFDDQYRVSPGAHWAGMVQPRGSIVIAEEELRKGFARESDGYNVGLHELAHVLDLETGAADGVPSGMPWAAIRPWLALMHQEMQRAERGRSVLSTYAATNEAELFAVASEAFFERPRQLRRRHPELYRVLQQVYGQDPTADRPG